MGWRDWRGGVKCAAGAAFIAGTGNSSQGGNFEGRDCGGGGFSVPKDDPGGTTLLMSYPPSSESWHQWDLYMPVNM